MATFTENNIEMFMDSLAKDAENLELASREQLNDENIIHQAAQARENSHLALKYASDRLKYDERFVKQVLAFNGLGLQFLPKEMRGNPEIVKRAVENNVKAIIWADISILKDARFMNEINRHCFSQSKESLLETIGSNAEVLKDAEMVKVMMNSLDPRSENDKKKLLDCSKQIANHHSDNVEIMSRLVDVDFENVKFASDKLKTTTLKSANDKLEALEGLKNGEKRLKDLDKGCFADREFFHKVKQSYDDRIKEIAKGGEKIDGLKEIVKLARMWAYMAKAKRTKEVSQQIERENDIRNKVEGYVNSLQNENEAEEGLNKV